MVFVPFQLGQEDVHRREGVRQRLVRPFQFFAAVEIVGRSQGALLHFVEDVLDVDQVPPFQSKVDAHTQELLGQHGHIESVAVEAAQIATMKPLEQSRGDATKRRSVGDILVVHAVHQAAFQRNWHFRVDQDAVFLAWGFWLFDHRAVGHEFDHGHFHNPIHPHLGPGRFKVKKHQWPLQMQLLHQFHHVVLSLGNQPSIGRLGSNPSK